LSYPEAIMTLPLQTPVALHTANGITTLFAFTFLVQLSGDLIVKVDGVTKTIGTDYSISGLGVEAGGSVTFVAAPANGAIVTIYRSIALQRTTDYQPNGDIPEDVIDADFDRLWMALQELASGAVVPPNVIRSPTGETLTELPAAASRALKFLSFDASGNPNVSTGTTPSGTPFTALADSLVSRATAALMRVDLLVPSRNEIVSQAWINVTTAGTGTAYTISPFSWDNVYFAGISFFVNFHVASGNNPTLTIGGLASPPTLVRRNASGGYTNILAGDIPAGHRSRVTLISTSQALVEELSPPCVVTFQIRSNRPDTGTLVLPSSLLTINVASVAAPIYSETIDTANAFNTTTGVFTAPRAGVYQFNSSVQQVWSASVSTGGPAFMTIASIGYTVTGLSSGSYTSGSMLGVGTTVPTASGSTFSLNMAAGDTVSFAAGTTYYNNTGSSQTLSPAGGAFPEIAQVYSIEIKEVDK
jgi:hypothetical protein